MCELGEHTQEEEPVFDCDCRRCAIAERDRLKQVLQGIADHHNQQIGVFWNDVSTDDMRRYHEDRRNIALWHKARVKS